MRSPVGWAGVTGHPHQRSDNVTRAAPVNANVTVGTLHAMGAHNMVTVPSNTPNGCGGDTCKVEAIGPFNCLDMMGLEHFFSGNNHFDRLIFL